MGLKKGENGENESDSTNLESIYDGQYENSNDDGLFEANINKDVNLEG